MTFTEAAIEVLRREGKPLHFNKIAEIAIREGFLDHVGKIAEETMGGQLAAHCRLPHADRRMLAVQPGTFALVEWGLDEDPHALDGMLERPPENEPPLRPRERHPVPSREVARSLGRGETRARRREEGEERRGRRFPPPAEVAYEILAGVGRPISLSDLAVQGAERFLMPDAFVRDTASLAAALEEDNRRRQSGGRKPLFGIDGDTVSLVAQPEPGERPAAQVPPMRASAAEMRRTALAGLRRRLRECDGPTVEHLASQLLERMGLREVKVAKRGREQVVFTGRRKIGLGDIRHCARVVRSGADVSRREVQEVRRDLGHYGAQVGILLTSGDASREGRGEASAAGQLPVFLLCGEALAEAFSEAGLGCRPIVIPEIDEAFFRQAAEAADREEATRRARREERERRERPERPEPVSAEAALAAGEASTPEPPPLAAAPAAAGGPVAAGRASGASEPSLPALGGGDEDEEEEGEEEAEGEAAATPQAEAEGRRRRRRRRRRGGRGRGRGERATPGAPGQSPVDSPAEGSTATPGAAPQGTTAESVPPPVTVSEPVGGGDGGSV